MKPSNVIVPLCALLMANMAPEARAEIVITETSATRCYFAGQELTHRFKITGLDDRRTVAAYRLSSANHTIASSDVVASARRGHIVFERKVKLPELDPGLAVNLQVEVVLRDAETQAQLAATNFACYSFSPDAFAHRQTQLEALNLALYDPERTTTRLFDEIGIPYTFLRSLAPMLESDTPPSGLLLVGEGVNPAEFPELWNQLTQLSARGIPVLCLAMRTIKSNADLGGGGAGGGPGGGLSPESVVLRRHGALATLDKRFDTHAWGATRVPASHSLRTTEVPGIYQLHDNAEGWLWLEQKIAPTGAPLLLCQFRAIQHWESSPVPRYLLLTLFDNLSAHIN
jgi:hypothetical protein